MQRKRIRIIVLDLSIDICKYLLRKIRKIGLTSEMSKRSRRPRKTNGQYSLTWEGLARNFAFKNWQKIDDKLGPDDHDLDQFHPKKSIL